MEIKLNKKNNRYYIIEYVKNHYRYRAKGMPRDYYRKVYGIVKGCKNCNKSFFSRDGKSNYCNNACSKIKELNPQWKGGIKYSGGYVSIKSPNHPFKTITGYVLEHRLVMEKHLKRYLKPYEIIHHKNAVKDDNRIENLEIILQSKKGFHRGCLKCPNCNYRFFVK